jgi:hypothetical protein
VLYVGIALLACTAMLLPGAQPVAPENHRIETQGTAAQETAESPD